MIRSLIYIIFGIFIFCHTIAISQEISCSSCNLQSPAFSDESTTDTDALSIVVNGITYQVQVVYRTRVCSQGIIEHEVLISEMIIVPQINDNNLIKYFYHEILKAFLFKNFMSFPPYDEYTGANWRVIQSSCWYLSGDETSSFLLPCFVDNNVPYLPTHCCTIELCVFAKIIGNDPPIKKYFFNLTKEVGIPKNDWQGDPSSGCENICDPQNLFE